ncbi:MULTISPECIES: DEAD/DEAH box helicase [Paenibacillus]|uniref:DEAD/DEAH box helicase n=1 Tax=Paenibacillus TaxID=44249 RepID=UPI0022B86C2D|nr:SNF2 helicase associated domain-containing protein [Paenibacillus caseinilyticus]MCZ8521237.1 SNF2 helicase associated domain-containing protein [Paenibacillus caseinilyticus]
MGFILTEESIKGLCGRFSYEEGEAYYEGGKVNLLPGDRMSGLPAIYEADVEGERGLCRVSVDLDREGEVYSECSCPAYHPDDKYCAHIAAVLMNLHRDPPPEPEEDEAVDGQLAEGMLGLFGYKPRRASGARPLFDTRTVLGAEFTCKPVAYGDGRSMLVLTLRMGAKRLHPVQHIRELLEAIDRREPYGIAKGFRYDPDLHSFAEADDAVLRCLIGICRNETLYRDPSWSGSRTQAAGREQALELPPYVWDTLSPLLAAAPAVRIEQNGAVHAGITVAGGTLPLEFRLAEVPADEDRQRQAYLLEVEGLDRIVVLEAYRLVLCEGTFRTVPEEECVRLSELKRMLGAARRRAVRIGAEQAESFLEKVIPGLAKLGSVRIEEEVSERILHAPLKARLYLDRVRDRLLAALEFQYGDLIINPLEDAASERTSGPILMRDGERERAILELMEQGEFAKTEAGYVMDEEEAEYDFLYRVVPQLEKLLQVFATSAVKLRVVTGTLLPKATVDVGERTDWLEFKFELQGIPESEIRRLLHSLQEKRRYHRLPDGSLLPLEGEAFQEILRTMTELGIRPEQLSGPVLRLPVFRGLHLAEADGRSGSVSLGKSLRRMLEHMRNPDHLEFPVPDRVAPVLRDYQAYGYQWMKTLARYGFGGILADDMGLGKTLQSIAFLLSVLPEIREERQPALVVCPASLMYNWLGELRKFAPEIRAVVADGSRTQRNALLRDSGPGADVIITSYPLLRRDIAWYAGQTFHTLILDEAQAYKNHATQTAQAVGAVRARVRFALTGTPVENRLEELWSIYNGVFPELLPPRSLFHELTRESVARRIRPFLLRRLKTDVLKELPDKIETLQSSELLPEQKKLYAAYLAQLQEETLKHLSEQGFEKHRIRILAGLTRLRQLCCHPALFVEGYEGSSAKFEQLLELIDDCRSAGRRLLVFSQFTEMLGIISRELGYRGVPFFYLDGRTPAAERVELCSRFNEGEGDLFLVSLKAGGTGLNLTGADTVVLYDLWWNPAVEEQAAGRAHRIGQKHVVQVVRLVARGTVEDKMFELQQRKKNLIEEIIRPGEETLSSLTEQEVREILMLHP